MNGAHLGHQQGITLLVHLLGKFHPLILLGGGLGQDLLFLTHIHGRQQTPNPNPHGAQIVYLVNFQQGIKLVALFQDFRNLIGGHRIQAAAEGVQLHQLQIIPFGNEFRGGIHPGMVHPLIHHPQGTLLMVRHRQAVLGKHGQDRKRRSTQECHD